MTARDDRRSITVLVVDDNLDAARSMATLISEMGCSVRQAHDSATALAIAMSVRPTLVLVDVVMPRMDGIELAEALRKVSGLEDTRIVAVSGHDPDQWLTQMAAAGVDGFMPKPLTVSKVDDLLRSTAAR